MRKAPIPNAPLPINAIPAPAPAKTALKKRPTAERFLGSGDLLG
jgi:hypothetical protein